MHELSIAESIVQAVVKVAEDNHYGQIKSIRLEIGALSGIVEDSLSFCFPVVAEGTALEGVSLDIINVPLTLACRDCGSQTCPKEPWMICGQCQGSRVDVIAGKEMTIKSIEVE